MTTIEAFSRGLAAHGYCFDTGEEQFFYGDGMLDWEEVIGLVPGMTLDELAG